MRPVHTREDAVRTLFCQMIAVLITIGLITGGIILLQQGIQLEGLDLDQDFQESVTNWTQIWLKQFQYLNVTLIEPQGSKVTMNPNQTTSEHEQLFKKQDYYQTVVYQVDLNISDNISNYSILLNQSKPIQLPFVSLNSSKSVSVKDQTQCWNQFQGRIEQGPICNLYFVLRKVCISIDYSLKNFTKCSHPRTHNLNELIDYGEYSRLKTNEGRDQSDQWPVLIVIMHEKDPLFRAIKLSNGSLSFEQYPWVFILFGSLMFCLATCCVPVICRSCYRLQVKEAQRIRDLRRERYLQAQQTALEEKEKKKKFQLQDRQLTEEPTVQV